MTISFDKKVSVQPGIHCQELDGESVFLNLNSGRYFGLDEVGTRMWKVLTTAPTIQAGYELLLAEYDVEEKQLQQDVNDLLEKLVAHGLVEAANP
jgi:hypothetical protein